MRGEMMSTSLTLDSYRLLGRSGLRVSPLSLGTMTFGTEWGWGADRQESGRIFNEYVERGGNFIDTANMYTNGTAEELIGSLLQGRREQLVIGTKYTLPMQPGNANSCGNHRKNMVSSAENSLRRLRTDYIDVFYLHAWDATTPIDEILRALDDLVRAGKVLYLGISGTVAWQISRMQATADLRGWSPFIALQIEYNLVERTAERELIPMAMEMGLGVIPSSPLAGGVLTGKYTRADVEGNRSEAQWQGSRRGALLASGALSQRNLVVAEVVRGIAAEIERPPSQVALAWLLSHRAVASPTIGAHTLEQLHENIGALEVSLTSTHLDKLARASAIEPGFPHDHLARMETLGFLFGNMKIARRGSWPST